MPRELKMLPMGTRDSALRVKMLPMGTQGKKRKPRQMVASCSPKLRSDPTFKIAFFFLPLGPHSGSGAVPRTPALPGYCRGIAGTQIRGGAPARAHALRAGAPPRDLRAGNAAATPRQSHPKLTKKVRCGCPYVLESDPMLPTTPILTIFRSSTLSVM